MIPKKQTDKEIKNKSSLNWDKLIKEFIESHDVHESTRVSYQERLLSFSTYITTQHVNIPTRKDIINFKDYLIKKGLSVYTINNRLVALRNFFAFLESEMIFPNIAKVKNLKKPKGFAKSTLSLSQIRCLLESIETNTLKGARDYFLILLLAKRGLRTIEVTRCKLKHFRYEHGNWLLYIKGKNHSTFDDFIILDESLYNSLSNYLAMRKNLKKESPLIGSLSSNYYGNTLTTRSMRRIIKNYFKSILKIDDPFNLTAHSFRHSMTTIAMQASGGNIRLAQHLARHQNIQSTLVYEQSLKKHSGQAEKILDSYFKENGI